MSKAVWYDLEEVAERPMCGPACEGREFCKRIMACVWEGRCSAPASVLGYDPAKFPPPVQTPSGAKE
jgi:hypothetical protein